MTRLEGRSAVITGGGRGIGAACARALADAGARVVVTARTAPEVEAVADSIRESGGAALAYVADVTDESSVEALAAFAQERVGPVEVLVNNAGIAVSAPVHRTRLEDWNRVLAVNATGTFLCTRAFLPGMVAGGWGRIVNVASVAGLEGAAYISAYAASKHAQVGFTRAVAAEVASKGVTVNAVCPGYVDTAMTQQSVARIVEKTGKTAEEAMAAIVASSAQGRLIRPEEVADLALSLCDDSAGNVTGQALLMDGGGGSG